MKITWVMPSKVISGGNRVIFEYANRLQALGHQVTCIVPFEEFLFPNNWLKRTELWLRRKIYYQLKFKKVKPYEAKVNWFPLKTRLIQVPDLSAEYIPKADIVIATAWGTSEWVATYPKEKGSKFYFIQHYETWAGPKKRVDQTYKLPLKKITIASWLKNLFEKQFQEKVYATITNGINLEQFYNHSKKYNSPRRIGMLYHHADWKGVADGIKAFEIAKQKFPEIKLVMFGVEKGPMPDYVEFHQNPDPEILRQIYCSLDIFLSPSWTEGCHLPPMEAMACQAAVVATNVGGIPDYAIAGETALVSEPKNPQALANNLITLLSDENKLKAISTAGHDHIKQFSWDKATKKFELALQANQ